MRNSKLISSNFQLMLLLLCLILTACGGGGGGGGSSDSGGSDDSSADDGSTDNGGNTSNNSSGEINSGLSGKFLYENSKSAYLMDISSGEYIRIPNTDWISQNTRFPLSATYFVKASADNTTFWVTAIGCRYHTGDVLGGEDTCVSVQDFNGVYIADIIVDWDLKTGAEPSPDGQYFAAFRELDDIWLEIWDIQGNRIGGINTEVAPFEWLADGRLIYIYEGKNFIITDPYSTNYSTSWSLPDSFGDADISHISASPDGTKIAFNVYTSGTLVSKYATFWMLDVETGSLRQIATNAEGDDAFGRASWSPDGTKIAVLEGGSSGLGPDSPGVSTVAYVLPADSDDVLQVARVDESLRSPDVIMLERFRHDDIPVTSDANSLTESFSGYLGDWLPE